MSYKGEDVAKWQMKFEYRTIANTNYNRENTIKDYYIQVYISIYRF